MANILGLRVGAIRDPHGRDEYKKLDSAAADIFFCPGDIVDVPQRRIKDELNDYIDIPFNEEESKENNNKSIAALEGVLQIKAKLGKKLILLLGNHDVQYLWNLEKFSGYSPDIHEQLHDLFLENIASFDFLHRIEDVIFSHAGITKDFAQYYYTMTGKHIESMRHTKPIDTETIIGDAITPARTNINNILLQRQKNNDAPNGPLRTELDETIQTPLQDVRQIFGHHNTNREVLLASHPDIRCVDTYRNGPIHYINI